MKKEPIKKLSLTEQLMNKLNIDETLTKPIKYHYPKVKNQTFPQNGFNYQADLLELPTTKSGYKYLLTVVDIYSNYVDFEELKTKYASDVLKAFKTIFKRGILPMPKGSLRTDNGSEFKSVVDQFMYDNSILHLWSLPNRHKQMANVESLNKKLGRILMTYITNKSKELGENYTNWDDIVDFTRHNINDYIVHKNDVSIKDYSPRPLNLDSEPKYNVGDLVYRRLEKPLDQYGNRLHDSKFRQGDCRYDLHEPRKIVKVLAYTSNDPWRYILADLPNVSYAEKELLPAKESEEKRIVKKVIDKMKLKNVVYYRVWFKGELKKDALWLKKDQLLEDGLQDYIQAYEDDLKSKK